MSLPEERVDGSVHGGLNHSLRGHSPWVASLMPQVQQVPCEIRHENQGASLRVVGVVIEAP